jgi:hypothetical protein
MSQIMAFHYKILNIPLYFDNIKESCTFQKIYGFGKVKLQTKWTKKNTKLVENL